MYITELSSLLLKSQEGNNVVALLNDVFSKLIENDRQMSPENSSSPQLWEQRWLNDWEIRGYDKGAAVWLNTQSYDSIVQERYLDISSYVVANPVLSKYFKRLDTENANAVFGFFKRVAEGTADSEIPALYYLGDISAETQIMVSMKTNNKDLPSTLSSWKPFLSSITPEYVSNVISAALKDEIENQLSAHDLEYHISALPADIEQKLVKRNDISNLKSYYFYDFEYSSELRGFDYIVDCRYDIDKRRWHRLWKSGYLENGGYIEKSTEILIGAEFSMPFNYPETAQAYQTGFDVFEGRRVTGRLPLNKRYQISVTPETKPGLETVYPESFSTSTGGKTYGCVDVTSMSNSGFQIVNSDGINQVYDGYWYYASGFILTEQ